MNPFAKLYKEHKFVGCIHRTSLQACPMTELCKVTNLFAIGEFNAMVRGVMMAGMTTERFDELLQEMHRITFECPIRVLLQQVGKAEVLQGVTA